MPSFVMLTIRTIPPELESLLIAREIAKKKYFLTKQIIKPYKNIKKNLLNFLIIS